VELAAFNKLLELQQLLLAVLQLLETWSLTEELEELQTDLVLLLFREEQVEQ
jgi:hypothetical protein